MRILLILASLLAFYFPASCSGESDMLNNMFTQQWGAAVDEHDPVWQFRQGKKLDTGDGVEQDKAKALSWYRKSAEQGYAEAQLLLGIIYDQGIGVTQDYAEAVTWYTKAAEQGYARAQYNLAAMYDEGLGVDRNYQQAVEWYRKAAEQGFARAQFNLGSMYFKGDGVVKNAVTAYMWVQLAAAQGLEEQAKDLIALQPPMSSVEIKKAKTLLAAWRAKHKTHVGKS